MKEAITTGIAANNNSGLDVVKLEIETLGIMKNTEKTYETSNPAINSLFKLSIQLMPK